MAWEIKQNSTRPIYIADLLDNVGQPDQGPLDLTDADTVSFVMRLAAAHDPDPPKVKGACEILDAPGGRVAYTWQPGDTDTIGAYKIEFEIIWGDGGEETVPNNSYLSLTILDDLG